MSHQIDNAIGDLSKAMNTLREAVKDIPVRREGFKGLHDTFTKSVAKLTTETSYARGLLSEDRPARSRRRR
ncbi:hypothetical protein ACFFQW_49610 [Umezawaea endophytica]|uniref:hypothetical protein n=1 Tax=Umezawaea endophytica TaxID=1654476 RepID=UPI0035E78355